MERLTRAKAIKAKCLDCCCGSQKEVKLCPSKDCPLWIYRLGKEVTENTPKLCQNTPQNYGFSDTNSLG